MNLGYLFARGLKKIKLKAIKASNVDANARIGPGSQVVDSIIGNYSYCGEQCTIIKCEIGAFTSIADYVSIGGVKHDFKLAATSKVFQAGKNPFGVSLAKFPAHPIVPTAVGSDVFIGKAAVINAGVSVGHGAIVGAGSIVTKDVPAYSIVAGVPARHLGFRFEEDIREALLAAQWWNLPAERVMELANYFDDVEKLLRELK